jgi:CheY-like chemotaxis protein
VIELAAGESTRCGVSVGDHLGVLEIGDRSKVPGTRGAVRGTSDSTRVLIVGSDRRFRAVTAALLTRRGCAVTVSERMADVAELAEQQAADVVVFDADALEYAAARMAAQIEMLAPRVGVVIVAEGPHEALSTTPVIPKWGSFEDLYAAIEHAHPGRAGRRSSRERL